MQTFRKEERLCSNKVIGELFEKGNSFLSYPLSVRWIIEQGSETKYPAKVLFVVSKRHFKHAVKRNRIKRLLKECYRKNKEVLYSFLKQENISISFSMVYVSKSIPDYAESEKAIVKALSHLNYQLAEQLKKQEDSNENKIIPQSNG